MQYNDIKIINVQENYNKKVQILTILHQIQQKNNDRIIRQY